MSLRVAEIKGIPIRLHFTLIIVFFLISWTLAIRLMPQTYPGLAIIHYWIMGVLGAGILFISVLLHELAHSILALRYGIRVRQIMLFIFGGVSDMEEDDDMGREGEAGRTRGSSKKDFRKEFKIAIVGPLISFVIAGVLALTWWILVQTDTTGGSIVTGTAINIVKKITEGVLQYGALVNILLGGFNLIPAFPLDGGRILRSALLRWKKDYDQSTKIAVKIGIAISYGFMALGFITMFSGEFVSGMWILLIGWFLNNGAQSYLAQQETSSILSKIHLKDIMNTQIISVKEEDITINSLIKDYFNIYAKDSFPIVNELNYYLIGMVTFKDAWNVSEDKRDIVKARDIMIPVTNLIVMQQKRTANEALIQMTRKGMGKVFVCNEEGKKLIGLVSKTDLINAVRERKEYLEVSKKYGSRGT